MKDACMTSDTSIQSIAIDGPAGAGKSTVARSLALRLGMAYIDTGAMYRSCALKAIRSGVSMEDEAALTDMMEHTQISFRLVNGEQHVFMDGEDVSLDIRTPDVTRGSSDIAKSPVVRENMVALQRRIARREAVVMDGRDIGSHVLPDARHKFFLTATPEVRAQRRLRENREKKAGLQEYEAVLADLRYRDLQDSTRAVSPLIRAQDAIEIDTSGHGIDAVVEILLGYIFPQQATCDAGDVQHAD